MHDDDGLTGGRSQHRHPWRGMTAHSGPISSRFIAGIAFGIVVFPAGGGAVYRVGVGKEIRDRDMNKMVPPLRSFLFAPGKHARRVKKALPLDADAVILDLEDAVANWNRTSIKAAPASGTRHHRQGDAQVADAAAARHS